MNGDVRLLHLEKKGEQENAYAETGSHSQPHLTSWYVRFQNELQLRNA